MTANFYPLKIFSVPFLLYSIFGWGQNLVKNPSFEDHNACPDALGTFGSDVISWSAPTEGSTDYFNTCGTTMGIPDNFNGSQTAKFGEAYAGMYLYAPGDYREYIQAELAQKLIKGEKYILSFYISRAEKSNYAIRDIQVLFSTEKIDLPIKKELSKMQLSRIKENRFHWVQIPNTEFYSESEEWILISTEFAAEGHENFMTIGNFKSNRATRVRQNRTGSNKGAYYYVDMVSLMLSPPKGYALNKPQKFGSVLFDFDKYELHETSIKELNELYSYLQRDKDLLIQINGYTDSLGSDSYNRSLSAKRAEAVAAYLLNLGLEKSRIAWAGHGGENPIDNNDTPEGRKQNRRVEFVISKRL